jgi:hypothetical protein
MMMKELAYHSLHKQLNEEKKIIFDDVMHRNNCTLIH